MNHSDEIEALYAGQTAQKYDDLVANSQYVGPSWLQEKIQECKPSGVSRILDLGCANGINGQTLKANFSSAELIGVDLTSDMIQEAAKTSHYHELHRANLDDGFGFLKGRRADLAVCVGVAEFFTDLPRFLKGLSEHLNAGSLAFLSFQEHDVENPNAPRQTRSGVVPHFAHTEKEIRDFLQAAGFQIQSLEKKIGYKSGRGYECPYLFVVAQKI